MCVRKEWKVAYGWAINEQHMDIHNCFLQEQPKHGEINKQAYHNNPKVHMLIPQLFF